MFLLLRQQHQVFMMRRRKKSIIQTKSPSFRFFERLTSTQQNVRYLELFVYSELKHKNNQSIDVTND